MQTIYYNGKITTMNPRQPKAEAILIRDGKIAAVGGSEEILPMQDENARLVDLQGAAVYPGLMDSHLHILSLGASRRGVVLDGMRSREEVLAAIGRRAAEQPEGTIIEARGFNQDLWPDRRLITKAELDEIAPRHGVKMRRVCGHMVIVNSVALQMAGIDAQTKAPAGGEIDFDAGILTENALNLLDAVVTDEGVESCKKLLLSGMRLAADAGLTAIFSDDLGTAGFSMHTVIQAYRELEKEGKMPVRVVQQCALATEEEMEEFLRAGYRYGQGSDWFRLGPRKLYTDGSLGARTAWLKQPYADAPDTRGVPVYTKEGYFSVALQSHRAGMPFITHAIGDAGVELVLDAIEYARAQVPGTDHLPDGIVHCQITSEAQLERIAKMGVHVYAQPVFVEYDLHICGDRVGEALAKTSYNWKTLLDKGVCISSGSDCPVESLAPAGNIYCAVTRKDYEGKPENGWLPDQCLTVEEAIGCHTRMAAKTVGMDDRLGCIGEGYLADLSIYPQDFAEMDPMEILHQQPIMTVVGGRERKCHA